MKVMFDALRSANSGSGCSIALANCKVYLCEVCFPGLLPRLDLNAKHLHSLDVSSCKSVSCFHSVAQQAAIPVSVQLLSTQHAVAGVLQLEAGYRAAIFVCALRSLSTVDPVEDVIRQDPQSI